MPDKEKKSPEKEDVDRMRHNGSEEKKADRSKKVTRDEQTSERMIQAQGVLTGHEEPQVSAHQDEDIKEPSEEESVQKRPFPIVGIGASAGGLEALEEFFKNVPNDSGMAYVIISHTDPARASLLPDIIQRKSKIPVIEVTDGMSIEPNTVYLPPSNRDLIIEDNLFRLREQHRGATLRVPIDAFFKSLAESWSEHACCVILSGTGTDGTQGLRVVKGKGGVTVVQSTESAKYEGMPGSAIGTGLADFVLTPAEMPKRIAECFSTVAQLQKPLEDEGEEELSVTVSKIITTISTRMGHDFSAYKKSTIGRRIQRRMTVTREPTPQKYLNYLHHNPNEIELLFQDLLIGVTSFFRDPEAFASLKQVLTDLLSRAQEHETFRVWASGCATGEEVYSIVILIMECLEELGIRRDIQVFGTDLDHSSIEKAREGFYPENIAADVSPERLNHFFEKESDGFRVRKQVREPIVFAAHNILRDPPFSRLDLLVCRNLLIYLEAKAQKKILPLFHYALKPGGVLFLGTAETVGESKDLFNPIEKKWSIYAKVDVSPALQPTVEFPTGGKATVAAIERALKEQPPAEVGNWDVAEATSRLLLRMHTPACVVVNRKGEINYIHGRTGKYLEPAPGRISVNVVDMAREGLRFELSSGLRKVASGGATFRREGLRVKTNGEYHDFNLILKPLEEPESLRHMIVILFEEIALPKALGQKRQSAGDSEPMAQRNLDLEREIGKVQQDHRTAMEELETSNEELKSVNEELQSSNEELQSTNEELESSREELQSLNEELSTVNAELHEKIVELSNAYQTINHVLNSTGIAILFLDRDFNIVRFTEAAKYLINLIDTDIGRPLTHVSANFDYDPFLDNVRAAILELKLVKMEMTTREGKSYSARIVPYQDQKGQITGAVITFVST